MRACLFAALSVFVAAGGAAPPPLKVLFLGDNGPHQPAARFRQLQPVFAGRGIALTYTDNLADLNPATLAEYNGLMVFANQTKIAPEQEQALLDYVASGKGFVPVHCASFCFPNSPKYIELVGAQFRSHADGVFRTEAAEVDHPVLAGFQPFSSWDETYVHHKHHEAGRTVLEHRTDKTVKEPWTWVRTQGKGRVFYTAWGHDHRAWGHPGFHNLLERGVRWACGQDPALAGPYVDRPEMTAGRTDVKPFEYTPATVPFYPAGEKWGTTREPLSKMQKPLPAAESVKHYRTPKGFELRTFVTEDKLGGGKPIAMTWDERGRLWLALTLDYPNEMRREGEGRDRIVCCEDADGDGACDTVSVFADRLSIPTSLLAAHGGLIVQQAPHTLFLKDTDGDGKADVRQVLFTGWGTRDTHAGPSSLRYGFDNWIYGMVGYSGFNGTVNGEPLKFERGLYRFKLDRVAATQSGAPELKVTKLEFLRSTNNNSWGVAFSEDGQLFGSTANNCPLVHLAVPNRYYEKVRGLTPGVLPNIALDNHFEPVTGVRQVDWHGGFTSAAGCAIYTARTYPPEYWNKTAFVSDPTGHLTATFVLQPHGTGYVARYGWNLVASDDEWAAPIDAQVGPDGHVWVLDWYNYIVQHNPTPQGYETGKGNAYETDLRDKKLGRVYRVVYTKAKPEPRVDLKGATPEKLVETLKHHNLGWRLHAQRLLVERGQVDVVEPLIKLVRDKSTDLGGVNIGGVHGLWTLAGLKRLDGETLWDAVDHPSPAVRRSAALSGVGTVFSAKMLRDADRQAVLAALLAACEWSAKDEFIAVELANAPHLASSDDKDIEQAYTLAAGVHDRQFLGHGAMARGSDLSPKWFALVQRVARSYAQRAPSDVGNLLFDVTKLGDAPYRTAVVSGIASGWPSGKKAPLDADGEYAMAELLKNLPNDSKGQLLKLASGWGAKSFDAGKMADLAKGLFATVADDKAADAARIDAARQAVEFLPESDDAAGKLVAAVTPATPPAVAAGVFEALAGSKAKGVGPAVVAKLKDLPPAARVAALQVVLARPEPAKAFLDAVEAGTLRFDLLALDQKAALAAHPDRTIADRAKRLLAQGGGLPDADRQKVIEELAHLIKKTGDVGLGKKAFTQHCAKCHKHGGEGQTIGPDLTGFAVHPKEETLVHILDPSRSVEGNFKTYTARLLDGRVLTGLLSSETRTAVELLDAENKRHAVSRDDLEQLKESDKSLMPEGFEKQMSADELAGLLEFLARKGKYVPVPLDRYATVTSTKGMFNSEDAAAERLVFPDWKPKEFKGVPFYLVDPQAGKVKNVILLHGPSGAVPPAMPKAVTVPCNTAAKAIHLLGGVAGCGHPASEKGTVSLAVTLHYDDGVPERHELVNGVHIADYIRRADVPGSEWAFAARGRQQVRYLAITPKRQAVIRSIEFSKGPDKTAPLVVAVTVETP